MTTQTPRRARRLKNLKINEVSSVDRGAGEGVRVMLSKRDTDNDLTRAFKALHTSCQSILDDPTLSADEQQDALATTMDQAHSFFGENFNIGKADDDDTDIEPVTKGHTMSAYDALMAKAVQLCKANPGLSRHQAFAKAYSDPANRALADADRVQRRSRHVHKDAEDRLTERAAELRKQNPHVSVDVTVTSTAIQTQRLGAGERVDPVQLHLWLGRHFG
jgi:hypothetical protein